jgi:hypothetical protein
VLWLGWDLLGWDQPVIVGSYVMLMVGREVYANKQLFSEFFDDVKDEAKIELRAARDILLDTTQLVSEAFGQGLADEDEAAQTAS